LSEGSQAGPETDESVSLSLLLVAEDPLSARRICELLQRPEGSRFEITNVPRVEDALERLQHGGFDLMLLDHSVDEAHGLDSLQRARVAARAIPVVVLTYERDEEFALEAVRAGAQDYLAKGEVTPALLSRTLLHAVERHRMMRELTEAQLRQQFLATHDPLTKLPNRYAFLASLRTALDEAKRRGSKLAVMFFDLDGFKRINDSLGHAAGDELLGDVAGRLRRLIAKGDLVARLGGDEFVAAIRDVPDEAAPLALAEQIRDAVEKPYYISGLECWVSASIGISIFPEDGHDAESLIRCADAAMYQSKASGKNQIRLFDREMSRVAQERFDLVQGLRDAIHSGLLALMFQPQIDIEREELIGAETLVRWRHPTKGLISPAEFIPVAEETGLMVPLGEWVLRTACVAAAGWSALPNARVAVNISGRQLEQPDFAERVQAILDETGLPAERLEVELTESLAASDSALAVLERLRGMGIRTAIDDFGTGYSSLTLLKRLPVDTLKIDRSFIHGAAETDPDAVILDAMIRIARGLGLEVVAEGVETLEEMDALRALGCNVMQGYLFSKPIPKADFLREVTAEDSGWRMPLDRPESWLPPGEGGASFAGESVDDPESGEDANLPAPAPRDERGRFRRR
jgi:diguanylate cyclase (GGDEF)-like protein